MGRNRLRSYDLDGKGLWELSRLSSLAIPTPFSSGGLLYVTSGYMNSDERPIYAIKPGASGDITLPQGVTSNEFIAWSVPHGGPYHPSGLVYQGHYYTLFDRGFLTCHDARTGGEVYGKQRVSRDSANFTASPWAYNGKLFCLGRGRQDVRGSGRARIQAPRIQQAGGNVHGHPRDRRRRLVDPDLLHAVQDRGVAGLTAVAGTRLRACARRRVWLPTLHGSGRAGPTAGDCSTSRSRTGRRIVGRPAPTRSRADAPAAAPRTPLCVTPDTRRRTTPRRIVPVPRRTDAPTTPLRDRG